MVAVISLVLFFRSLVQHTGRATHPGPTMRTADMLAHAAILTSHQSWGHVVPIPPPARYPIWHSHVAARVVSVKFSKLAMVGGLQELPVFHDRDAGSQRSPGNLDVEIGAEQPHFPSEPRPGFALSHKPGNSQQPAFAGDRLTATPEAPDDVAVWALPKKAEFVCTPFPRSHDSILRTSAPHFERATISWTNIGLAVLAGAKWGAKWLAEWRETRWCRATQNC